MRARSAIIAVLLAAVAASGCGGNDSSPVPRRRAWPRLPEYDTCYTAAQGAAARFYVNCAAETRTDSGGRWLTVRYPLYDAEIYVTVSRVSTPERLRAVLDNRKERMALNIGGASATTSHTGSPAGFEAALVEAPGSGTPLQFVATDGQGCVVSGAARLNVDAAAPYDSIRPVEQTLRRDIVYALKHLSIDD